MSDTPHTSANVDSLMKQIEALNLEKQQLISLVSHDLRSPLNRSFALAELLLMDTAGLSDFQKDYLEKLRLVIADGLTMMRNLVDYRNLEYRSIEILKEPVNVQEFTDRLIREFQPAAQKKEIQVQTSHTNIGLTIISDKQCLDRVIGNLLSNAFKFSKAGQTVFVRTSRNTEGKAVVAIEDEIGGFSEEDLKTLFSRFKKYKAQPTGNESSTGLGLFVAKAMAERVGGTVTCQSELGKGSVFTIVLPANLT